MNAVHKRIHAAQAEEFKLLVNCFKEHPESFWQRNRRPAYKWDEETFLKAIDNCELVPQADPNTASHGQRVMKIMALKQLQAASPAMYDPIAVDMAALQAIGWSNPQQFMVPTSSLNQKLSPEQQALQAKVQIQKQEADARMVMAKAKESEVAIKAQQGGFGPKGGVAPQGPSDLEKITAQARLMDAQTKAKDVAVRLQSQHMEDVQRTADRESKERLEKMEMIKDHMSDSMDLKKERLAAQLHVPTKGVG
jgi:hypothetical protein